MENPQQIKMRATAENKKQIKLTKITESEITKSIRNLLHLLRIPHWKTWGGMIGTRGVPDIVGTLPPTGRSLYLEVKRPGGKTSREQEEFLFRMKEAGAVTMVVCDPKQVITQLSSVGYEPATRISVQFERIT